MCLEYVGACVDGMIRRHGACTGMPCFGRDALLDWLALQRASLEGLGRQSKRSTTEGAVRDLPGHEVADGMEQETADASGVVLVQLPDATPQYACQVCGQYFATLHQVKTHEGRFHQEFAPKREMSNKADYSIGGLPQCRFCRQSFSRWTALQRHIRNNRCPGLRSTQLGQAGALGRQMCLRRGLILDRVWQMWGLSGAQMSPCLRMTSALSSNGNPCYNFRSPGAGSRL